MNPDYETISDDEELSVAASDTAFQPDQTGSPVSMDLESPPTSPVDHPTIPPADTSPLHIHVYFTRETDINFGQFQNAHTALTSTMTTMGSPTTPAPPGHLHFTLPAFPDAELILHQHILQSLATIIPTCQPPLPPNTDARDVIHEIRGIFTDDARTTIRAIRGGYHQPPADLVDQDAPSSDTALPPYPDWCLDPFTVTIHANPDD